MAGRYRNLLRVRYVRNRVCPGSAASRRLILLRYKPPSGEGCLVVVRVFLRSSRQLDLLAFDLMVRNQFEQEPDDIQARPALVVGSDDVPWRELRIGGIEHRVASTRILVPFRA